MTSRLRLASETSGSQLDEVIQTEVVCYDTETSDKEKVHSQILQFACLVADGAFRPLKEQNIRARRLPYVVPSPGALAVTGLTPESLDDPSLPDEFEFAGQVHDILANVGRKLRRVMLTFNGPKFDDPLIRQMLHRNLLDPYVINKGDVSRVDVLRMVHLALRIDPDILALREVGGHPSRKLEDICRSNGIAIDAHDAQGDTRATIELAGYIRHAMPWVWDRCLDNGNTKNVLSRLDRAQSARELVWTFNRAGRDDELLPCIVLGRHAVKKEYLLANLASDPGDFPESATDLFEHVGSDRSLLKVMANKSPMVFSTEEVQRLRPLHDPDRMAARARKILDRTSAVGSCLAAFDAREYPRRTDATSEESLYDGFPDDESHRKWFRDAPSWKERAKVEFSDRRNTDFAARILLRNGTDLDPGIRGRLAEACAASYARPHAPTNTRWYTLEQGFEEGDENWREWATQAFDVPAPASPRP